MNVEITSNAKRKKTERERAYRTFDIRPRFIYLSDAEQSDVRRFLLRKYGHDGTLKSRYLARQSSSPQGGRHPGSAEQIQLPLT